MARITVEDCLTKEMNRFALVLLASERTKQILDGSPLLTDESKGNKPVVMSLREIADGRVRFKTEEDLRLEAVKRQKELDKALANKQSQVNDGGIFKTDKSELLGENGSSNGTTVKQESNPIPLIDDSAEEYANFSDSSATVTEEKLLDVKEREVSEPDNESDEDSEGDDAEDQEDDEVSQIKEEPSF